MFFWRRRRHLIGEEDLSSYVDGQLAPAERARLEAHVESCAGCRETLAELRALQRSLRQLPEVRSPRSFALREADARPGMAPRALSTLERAPALLGGLAVVAFLAFGSLVAVDLAGQEAGDEGGMAVSGFEDRGEGQIVPEAPDAEADGTGGRGLDAEATAAKQEEEPTAQDRGERPEPATREADGGGEEEAVPGYSGEGSAGPQGTPTCPPSAGCRSGSFFIASPSPTITPVPTPPPGEQAEPEGGARVPLRAAEAATAALALLTTGSLALVLRRRRS